MWRLGRWGVATIAAVTLALLIGSSEMGLRRIALAVANIQGTAAPPQPRESGEIARLSEVLKRLTNDRDRLLARLDAIERNLDDLTGSVALNYTPPRPVETVPPPPAAATNVQVIVPPTVPSTIPPSASANTPSIVVSNAPASVPAESNPTISNPASSMPQSPPVPSAQDVTPADTPPTAKVDFGVDLGSAPTIEGLRALWTSAKGRHGALLDGLRPIVVLRERAKPGGVELRLVVGPLPSAAMAARMCVVITTTGTVCQPAVFDGQRLALR
jgi:hypothetical protein